MKIFTSFFNHQPLRANVFYWKVKKTGTYSLQTGFPTFYDDTASDPRKFYALPSFEYPDMVKVILTEGNIHNIH